MVEDGLAVSHLCRTDRATIYSERLIRRKGSSLDPPSVLIRAFNILPSHQNLEFSQLHSLRNLGFVSLLREDVRLVKNFVESPGLLLPLIERTALDHVKSLVLLLLILNESLGSVLVVVDQDLEVK